MYMPYTRDLHAKHRDCAKNERKRVRKWCNFAGGRREREKKERGEGRANGNSGVTKKGGEERTKKERRRIRKEEGEGF